MAVQFNNPGFGNLCWFPLFLDILTTNPSPSLPEADWANMPAPAFTVGWVQNLKKAPPSTDAGQVIALAVAFSAIAIISILLRVWSRWKVLNAGGLDDYVAAASMVCLVAGLDDIHVPGTDRLCSCLE